MSLQANTFGPARLVELWCLAFNSLQCHPDLAEFISDWMSGTPTWGLAKLYFLVLKSAYFCLSGLGAFHATDSKTQETCKLFGQLTRLITCTIHGSDVASLQHCRNV